MHGNLDTGKRNNFSYDVTGLKGRMIVRMTRMTMKNQELPLSFTFQNMTWREKKKRFFFKKKEYLSRQRHGERWCAERRYISNYVGFWCAFNTKSHDVSQANICKWARIFRICVIVCRSLAKLKIQKRGGGEKKNPDHQTISHNWEWKGRRKEIELRARTKNRFYCIFIALSCSEKRWQREGRPFFLASLKIDKRKEKLFACFLLWENKSNGTALLFPLLLNQIALSHSDFRSVAAEAETRQLPKVPSFPKKRQGEKTEK